MSASNRRHVPLTTDTKCFECNTIATVNHHIIPYSQGGRATVPLCNMHHDIVHGIKRNWSTELIKQGLAKARLAGKTLGAPRKFTREQELIIIEEWFKYGETHRVLAKKFNTSQASISRLLNRTTP